MLISLCQVNLQHIIGNWRKIDIGVIGTGNNWRMPILSHPTFVKIIEIHFTTSTGQCT